MPFVFAYGSIMKSSEMKHTCSSAESKGMACLPGRRVVFNGSSKAWGGAGAADLTADPDSAVWGVIWDLSDEDVERLDRREGVPHSYTPCEVEVVDPAGDGLVANTYTRPHPQQERAPSVAYAQAILEGASENNLPTEYQDTLRQWIREAGCRLADQQ